MEEQEEAPATGKRQSKPPRQFTQNEDVSPCGEEKEHPKKKKEGR